MDDHSDSGSTPASDEKVFLTAAEFADVYNIDTARAITEAKLQRWLDAMESEHAS